jgi:hypothetical protein
MGGKDMKPKGVNLTGEAVRNEAGSEKHPGGRPTDYRPEYCQMLVDFFTVEPFTETEVHISGKNWEKTETKLIPSKLPTFERFAHNIGVVVQTMLNWCGVYPEFLEAYTRAKQLQKDILVAGGLAGTYNSNFAIFVSQNFTDMRDKKQFTGSDDKPLVPSLSEEERVILQEIKAKLKGNASRGK